MKCLLAQALPPENDIHSGVVKGERGAFIYKEKRDKSLFFLAVAVLAGSATLFHTEISLDKYRLDNHEIHGPRRIKPNHFGDPF